MSQDDKATISSLVLSPRDGLFLKDARGWTTSATGRAHTFDWPLPSTMRGALRNLWGEHRQQDQGRRWRLDEWPAQTSSLKLSAFFAMRRTLNQDGWSPQDRMWHLPADLIAFEDKSFVPLAPQERADNIHALGLKDDAHARAIEALWYPRPQGEGKPYAKVSRWLTEDEMIGWLCGAPPSEVTDAEDRSIPSNTRLHVAIDPGSQTADDGRLYSTNTLEMLDLRGGAPHEWAIASRVTCPDDYDWTSRPATLGGKQRLTTIETAKNDMWAVPERLIDALKGKDRLRIVLTTPARFDGGWLPDGFTLVGEHFEGKLLSELPPMRLRAACVGRPQAGSGWDMAKRQPKRGVRLAPAGSVYFFELLDGTLTKAHIKQLWLASLGGAHDDGFGTQDGFGVVVPGVWKY